MDFKDTDFFNYETFQVFQLLKKANPGKEFKGMADVEGFAFPPDIYAPDGIPSLKIAGKTVIEVKASLNISTLRSAQSIFEMHGTVYNVLVVYFRPTISSVPSPLYNGEKVLRFVSLAELKSSSKSKFKGTTRDKYYLDKTKQRKWKEVRQALIQEAGDVVAQGNNVLFLGAGVSASAKMPSWEKLLQSLMGEVSLLKKETLEAFQHLNTHVYEECGDSNLIMARYLQSAIKLSGKKDSFSAIIQKHLYSTPHTSSLLTNLAQTIKQKKVSEVITYNFDDILEQELQSLGLKDSVDYTTIAKDAEVSGHNTLPIYHVHGIIPEKGPADTVVFSEEEYHDRYKDSYHWSNIEQLHALSRMHCFFIGLSMVDPNLRRLLDISRRINETDKITHYAFLRRTKLDEYCISNMKKACKYMHVSESLIDKKKQSEIYVLNYGVLESIYRELGVKVIWFENFEELPGLIADVFRLNSYEHVSNSDLLNQVDGCINQIKNIENNIPKAHIATLGINDVLAYIAYRDKHSKEYQSLLKKTKDMLDELSNRISISTPEDIVRIQRSIPPYNDNMSGFADIYTMLYEMVKKMLSN